MAVIHLSEMDTVKQHFYAREKFIAIFICPNGPLDKFVLSSALCTVAYGVIKIYAVQIHAISA